jgi:hypothetical protein
VLETRLDGLTFPEAHADLSAPATGPRNDMVVDRRTLFVCTSTGSGPAMADKRDGAIETVRGDVPGAGLP